MGVGSGLAIELAARSLVRQPPGPARPGPARPGLRLTRLIGWTRLGGCGR